MKEISLSTKETFKVSIDGNVFYLKDPLEPETRIVGQKMAESGESATEIFKEFVLSLGFPLDVWDSMGVVSRRIFSEQFMEGLTGKKLLPPS